MNSLVSIIIPTYNRGHLIGETLDSIIAQTYTNWECIIVDDGSTDDTISRVKKYCKIDRRFRYNYRPESKSKGANACRNYGFELCKGYYITWFDDDDLMHKNKLQVQIKILESKRFNFTVCQTQVFRGTKENSLGLRHSKIYLETPFSDFLTKKIVWTTPAALWRKSFLDRLPKLFDETLHAAQEWEFFSRVLFRCPEYSYTDEVLVFIREHAESTSYNKRNMLRRDKSYVMARIKISELLRGENNYIIEKDFLNAFVLNYYTKFLTQNNIGPAKIILVKYILKTKEMGITLKIKLSLALYLHAIFGSGYFLLKN